MMCVMRSVNVGELKNQLSAYLQYVRNGEEVIVRDRQVPVARILPFIEGSVSEAEAQLVRSGAMKLPEKEMNWDQFFSEKTGTLKKKKALEAALESRGDR
jgi:antitoxin (DNA-binding transcriptional repressor) of toxin-antitoxin stability system